MSKLTLALILILTAFPSLAQMVPQPVSLSWSNATQNTDTTPIEVTGPTSLVLTTVEWAACLADNTLSDPRLSADVTPNLEATVVSIGTAGSWCFTAFHTNEGGGRSVDSNITVKQIVAPPMPPLNLMVVDIPVFSVVKQIDAFLLVAVGTVPITTPCDLQQSVNGHNVVPISTVSWTGTVRSDVVVAKCN